MGRLRKYSENSPHVDVIRYTTFFRQFTLIFDRPAREEYVDRYGYSASVSPHILEQPEKEVGYPSHPEYIIDQGYMNSTYRTPSEESLDFQTFQRREVVKLTKEMVDITYKYGEEVVVFLGNHWAGTGPFMDEFKTIELDAMVGGIGSGCTLRLISDIKGTNYMEDYLLPCFFPDTFQEGRDPVKLTKVSWMMTRRVILREPIDRIDYGSYLKLALQFPEFVNYVEDVYNEFHTPYDSIEGTIPYCIGTTTIPSYWGKAWA